MERFPIDHPLLQQHKVELEMPSFWKGAVLVQNGIPLRRKWNKYFLPLEGGKEIEIVVQNIFVDPFPILKIEGQTVHVLPPLKLYEYIWVGLPMLLIFGGGAIGGFLGACAVMVNGRLFRDDLPKFHKYLYTGLTTFGAIAALLLIATVVSLVFGKR